PTSALVDATGAAAATLWYVPAGGELSVPIWEPPLGWGGYTASGALSLPLDTNAGPFAYHAPNQTVAIYRSVGPGLRRRTGASNAANNDFSNRALANISDVRQKDGIWVNSLAQYLPINTTGNTLGGDGLPLVPVNQQTYLGSFSTVAAGQGEDSPLRRILYN